MTNLIIAILLVAAYSLGAQDPVQRLEKSPRHHEWVDIYLENRVLRAFLVYPEVSENVPVVIVIHENRGLNDWARSMADQVAEAGYIALAPDLLWGAGPGGQGTSAFESSDDARTALYNLDPNQVTADLNASVEFAMKIPSGSGSVAVMGFCWGGSQSFRFATNNNRISAAIVCYGTGPENESEYSTITAPVYGFYGGNDNRVNATIEKTGEIMTKLGKTYEPVIYEGAGHGFFRSGEEPGTSEANRLGREQALIRLWKILSAL